MRVFWLLLSATGTLSRVTLSSPEQAGVGKGLAGDMARNAQGTRVAPSPVLSSNTRRRG